MGNNKKKIPEQPNCSEQFDADEEKIKKDEEKIKKDEEKMKKDMEKLKKNEEKIKKDKENLRKKKELREKEIQSEFYQLFNYCSRLALYDNLYSRCESLLL